MKFDQSGLRSVALFLMLPAVAVAGNALIGRIFFTGRVTASACTLVVEHPAGAESMDLRLGQCLKEDSAPLIAEISLQGASVVRSEGQAHQIDGASLLIDKDQGLLKVVPSEEEPVTLLITYK